ncbi:hypothetical protein G6F70_001031 [Rhizopus microsporus]|uniref:Uncharacterized protein n=2 Tax=Rhizopus TaxID=4842 RepID=A0A367K7A6_RHIAZ|nr:hypothetical protein G6F71_006629 [Rhizopus microsporus]RCH97721.1 hypothetical protein CU097_002284 [Rhizopus azygosporus]KAG1203795.1 hypothetical protein G6F70_001031 [Rhizopus microsporus]KAG1209202.1 hypothetical protein G6F69_006564 [Rhizopus microsporus]KAG1230555.1 hypothetical protein G6F67_006384 [Rhizopus microsporus]
MKLSTLILALFTVASHLTVGSTQGTFDLIANFREPKNILFACNIGGSSHIVWVLEILEELAARGHHVSFYTREDQAKFIQNYPSVELVLNGPALFQPEESRALLERLISMEVVKGVLEKEQLILMNIKEEYYKFQKTIDQKKIDVVLCDYLNVASVEAAKSAGIPNVITVTMVMGPDVSAPYINTNFFNVHHPMSKGVPFHERLVDRVINPLRYYIGARFFADQFTQEQMSVGIEPKLSVLERWEDSMKIVNSVFGFEFPRPMGPLVELIGPIVPRTYPTLNDELQTFLDHRLKVVYVAFGQLTVPTPSEIKFILTALLENMETKYIDGIIWSTRGIREHFPDIITTRTNTTYDINNFFTNPTDDSNIAFVNWAPQVAILHHPSTCLFLTHGGAGSLYESMHAAVPIAVFPYFSDQPATAISAEEHGTGRWLRRTLRQDQATDLIKEIVDDTVGKYRRNVDRFKALVQIRNAHGKQRGADLVEEAIFTHVNGKLKHRRDIRRDLSFFKAYNLDIYSFVLVSLVTFAYGIYRFVFMLYRMAFNAVSVPRMALDKDLKAN